MKRPSRILAPARILAALLAFLAPVSAPAQSQIEGPEKYRSRANIAMKNDRWDRAYKEICKAIQRFDSRANILFGGKFGWFWYHKGYCEMKMRQFGEAATSFETCYKRYPSNVKAVNGKSTGSSNYYHKLSLLKWGQALKGDENYEEAIKRFKQFLDEREQKDDYDKGLFHVDMSVCYSKIGKLPSAVTHLEAAIKTKNGPLHTPPNGAIMQAFYSLSEAAIKAKKESLILDFLRKNRGDIALSPFRMDEFVPLFIKLAGDAYQSDMKQAAFQFYSLIPGTKETAEDMEARLASLGPYEPTVRDRSGPVKKATVSGALKKVKERKAKGKANEVVTLGVNAYVHEEMGNTRGAYAIYKQLETYYPKRPKREDQLYELVRTSSIVGEVLETESYGQIFLKAYPGSGHKEAVQGMMLSSLFYKGEYEKCIEVAEVMLPKLAKKTEQHDICLHVLGGSYYYTGQFDKAHPLLKEHYESYGKKSKFKVASCYFYGANLSRLQEWEAAAKQLDFYLAEYPDPKDNPFLPFAFYDRASCHYAEEEMEPALARINRIETEFPRAGIMSAAYNLKGNILETTDKFTEAVKYYQMAHDLAVKRKEALIPGEASYYLVSLLGREKWGNKDNPRHPEAVPHYDRFWKEYAAGSPYKPRVAVVGLYPLGKAGRREEALGRLQGVIAEMAKVKGAAGLEEAINSYTEAYLEDHTPEQLKDHYYEFPGIDANDKATLALLRIAVIGVAEDSLQEAQGIKDPARKKAAIRKAEATIDVLFRELDRDFEKKSLTNYILVRIGDYLRTNTANPRRALPYYKEIIRREDQSYRFPAIFGQAEILGASDNSADRKEALKNLQFVYTNSQDKKEREKSLYRVITTHAKGKEWADVEKRAKEYLDRDKGFNTFQVEVRYILAQSFDGRKMPDEAYAHYFQVYHAYKGYILYSARCGKRMMEILWDWNKTITDKNNPDRSKPSRQIAYETGWKYIDQTKHLLPKMKDEEKGYWEEVEKLAKKYEASGQITDMETLKKQEEEEARRR